MRANRLFAGACLWLALVSAAQAEPALPDNPSTTVDVRQTVPSAEELSDSQNPYPQSNDLTTTPIYDENPDGALAPDDALFIQNDPTSEEENDIIELSADTASDLSLPDPLYTIESIKISGNSLTSTTRVQDMLGVSEGDRIQLRKLEDAKLRLSAGGNFEKVEMSLLPGSDRFKVKIVIKLSEQLNIQFNDYYIGTSDKSNFWLGLNASLLNLLGTGHRLTMGFVATQQDDYSWFLGYTLPKLANSPVFLSLGLRSSSAAEELFVRPGYVNDNASWITQKDRLIIHRHGFDVIAGLHPVERLSLILGVQSNFINRIDDKVQNIKKHALDDFVRPGKSKAVTLFGSIAYDSRDKVRLTTKGHQVGLNATGTFQSGASDYEFIRLMLFHQSNFMFLPDHLFRIYTRAGAVFGDAPYYEKFLFNDYYLLNPGRVMGLNPSSAAPFDLFNTGANDLGYEDFIVSLMLEYAWQKELNAANIRQFEIFARINAVYADSFKTSPLALGTNPGSKKRSSFPCDASLDFGVNFETNFGFFKLSLGYVLNLIPR